MRASPGRAWLGLWTSWNGAGWCSARSTEDRRRNMLVVTEKGERTMTALFAEVQHIEDPIQAALSPEELAQFIDFIDRANTALAQSGG